MNLFSNLLNHQDLFNLKRFIKIYARDVGWWHNVDGQTNNLGYGFIHYAFIRNLKPKRILCIGSRYGFIPAICSLACKDNHRGVVDFVDAGYNQDIQDPHHWGGVGVWKKVSKDKYFKPFGLAPYINLHVMTSEEYVQKYPKRKNNYIHLDGDHSYVGVKSDYNRFWPTLTKNGYMCLHDIYTKNLGQTGYGVAKFWLELCNQHANTNEFPGPCGLGIIQKND